MTRCLPQTVFQQKASHATDEWKDFSLTMFTFSGVLVTGGFATGRIVVSSSNDDSEGNWLLSLSGVDSIFEFLGEWDVRVLRLLLRFLALRVGLWIGEWLLSKSLQRMPVLKFESTRSWRFLFNFL